jgi:SAM-dependent methyltransferase
MPRPHSSLRIAMKQIDPDIVVDSYNQHGERYSARRLSGGMLFNDYIELPIVKGLLGSPRELTNARVLDIGCGPGVYTKLLLRAGAKVVALDSSAVMLRAAINHCNDLDAALLGQCKFIQESFETVDLAESSFDVILATFMLSYFADLTQALSKMRASLARGGRIIASILHPVRLFAIDRDEQGYLIGNYFSDGFYKADFLDESSTLPLRRYNFEQLHSAADDAGLRIAQLIEPRADPNCGFPDPAKIEFYSANPSILILEMKQK